MFFRNISLKKQIAKSLSTYTGSCSTFEFSSRVNLSGLSLYCIARTLGKRTGRCNKVDAVRLGGVEFTFTTGSEVRAFLKGTVSVVLTKP